MLILIPAKKRTNSYYERIAMGGLNGGSTLPVVRTGAILITGDSMADARLTFTSRDVIIGTHIKQQSSELDDDAFLPSV